MALPAQATEWMECTDPTQSISVRVLLGAMDVISVNTVEIVANGARWTTEAGGGATVITRGQAFETADQIWIDMTDEQVDQIVAKLRLFKAMDDGGEGEASPVIGGTLEMPAVGAWAVHCPSP
jgi:hypothetical protein